MKDKPEYVLPKRLSYLRTSWQYKQMKKSVIERDEFECIDCGKLCLDNVQFHHKKEVFRHPELTFNVDNIVSICKACHKIRHDIADERAWKRVQKKRYEDERSR